MSHFGNNRRNNGRGRGGGGNRHGGGGGGFHGGGGSKPNQHGGRLLEAKYKPCREFTQAHLPNNNGCPDPNCSFGHIAKCHKFIEGYDGSSNNNGYRNNNNIFSNNKDSIAITSTTVATTPGAFIVITGSSDGKFRLFNGGEMCKPIGDGRGIQPPMVEKNSRIVVKFSGNFLFVAYEGRLISDQDPSGSNNNNNNTPSNSNLTVGYICAYTLQDLNSPQPAPQQVTFFVDKDFVQFASERPISKLECIEQGEGTPPIIVAGSKSGLIRVWVFEQAEVRYKVAQVLQGHIMDVSGITFSGGNLWTTSLDRTLRVWDYQSGKCQGLINNKTENGHSAEITNIMPFQFEGNSYMATSSCDKTVKIWDQQGNHMVTSDCGNEVISIGLVTDSVCNTNKSVLLCGLQNGRILVRMLPSLILLATFDPHLTVGHKGAVMSIVPGPSNTFFTGGMDGICFCWGLENNVWAD